jgi:hypothetical protein
MLPLPEAIRLSIQEALLASDAGLLKRAYQHILFSLEGPAGERVGRDILVLCAEVALKVRRGPLPRWRSTNECPEPASLQN